VAPRSTTAWLRLPAPFVTKTDGKSLTASGSKRALLLRVPLIGACLVMLAGAGRAPDEWPVSGRDQAGTYHSPLKDINASNVSHLGFAWEYQTGTHRGLEATPLMLNGVLYTSGNFGVVYALDAATGAERWVYDPGVDGQAGRYGCCDAVNRGVAASQGRIYVAALDGFLHSIDAATGKRVWKVDTLPARGSKTPYTITGTPVIAGGLVIIGAGGGDFHGVRGYVAAFDAHSGQLRWRFYTVPRNPALGAQDQPHLVDAIKTWDPHHRWETGGGGPVWDGISYDPVLRRTTSRKTDVSAATIFTPLRSSRCTKRGNSPGITRLCPATCGTSTARKKWSWPT